MQINISNLGLELDVLIFFVQFCLLQYLNLRLVETSKDLLLSFHGLLI